MFINDDRYNAHINVHKFIVIHVIINIVTHRWCLDCLNELFSIVILYRFSGKNHFSQDENHVIYILLRKNCFIVKNSKKTVNIDLYIYIYICTQDRLFTMIMLTELTCYPKIRMLPSTVWPTLINIYRDQNK